MKVSRRIFAGLAAGGCLRGARSVDDVAAVENDIFEAVNRERQLRGVPALVWNEKLAAVARRHSREMQSKQFFGHTDPRLGNVAGRLRAAGIAYRECGENLYRQFHPEDAGEGAVASWMSSEAHRSNLLKRAFCETAAGVAIDARGRCLVTQIFLG